MTQRLRLLCRQIYLPDVSRLAAFGVLPAYRGQGLAKKFLLDLLAALRDKELYSIRLEIRDNKHAWCAVAELMGQPQIRCIFVEPAYRHQGRTRRILMKINARWPDICTSAAVPETLEPLFIAAGYQANSLCQFEMALDL